MMDNESYLEKRMKFLQEVAEESRAKEKIGTTRYSFFDGAVFAFERAGKEIKRLEKVA